MILLFLGVTHFDDIWGFGGVVLQLRKSNFNGVAVMYRLTIIFLAIFVSGYLVACQEETSFSVFPKKRIQVFPSQDKVKHSSTIISDAFVDKPICFAPQEIIPFAFAPDASKIYVRIGTGIQIFDLQTGQQVSSLDASQPVVAATLSPNGQILSWSLQDHRIQLLNFLDPSITVDLIGHPDPVFDLRFSPESDKLYSASHDGLVRVWNLDGKQISAIEAGGEVLGFGLSRDELQLATIPFAGPVSLWDLATGQKITEFSSTGGYDTSDAHFSPDGQYLAADLATGLYLWRISDGILLWNDVKNSMAITFSPDGQYLAYSDIEDGNTIVLASPDGSQIIRTLGSLQGPVWEIFFSPDGSLLATSDGLTIPIWHAEDGELLYIGKRECP